MNFLGTICLPVTLYNMTVLVPFHIGEQKTENVIIGTNALKLLELSLAPRNVETTARNVETAEHNKEHAQAITKERSFISAHSTRNQ